MDALDKLIEDVDLLLYAYDKLDEEKRLEIEAKLGASRQLRTMLEVHKAGARELIQTPSYELPDTFWEWAESMNPFSEPEPALTPGMKPIVRWIAELIPTLPDFQPVPTRGSLPESLGYRVKHVEVNIERLWTANPERKQIMGRIFHADSGRPIISSNIRLIHPRWSEIKPTRTNKRGAFLFETVPAGRYQLTIELSEAEVVIEELPV